MFQDKQTPEARLLGVEEAAAYLGFTSKSLYRLINQGIVTPVKVPGLRRTFLDRRDLDTLIEEAKSQAGATQ